MVELEVSSPECRPIRDTNSQDASRSQYPEAVRRQADRVWILEELPNLPGINAGDGIVGEGEGLEEIMNLGFANSQVSPNWATT